MHGEVYIPQESLTTGSQELIGECIDKGTTHDDAMWTGNRGSLDDFLVAAHMLDLQAELAALAPAPVAAPLPPPAIWEAFAPSHPHGLGPWLPNSGKHRTHFALKRVGAATGVSIPADAASFLGMTLLRILDLDSTMVGWQGLTLDTKSYMISASLCGVKETLNPTQDVILEGFELVQPFRLFEEELAKLVALPTVTKVEDAWIAFKADATQRLFVLTGLPLVDLDNHLLWSGNAVDEFGKSVLTSLDMADGAPPGYAGLATSLGVKADQTFYQQKTLLAVGFGQASLEASFNQTTASKGKSHRPISAVDPDALSRDKNPVDGSDFPVHIRAADRLKQVSRLANQVSAPSLLPCQCF